MSGPAAEHVVSELSGRAERRRGARRPLRPRGERLELPDLASIQILSERRTSDRCAAAVAVNDMDGERYLVIGVFADEGGGLRGAGGCEGHDREVLERRRPYLGLYAYANGHFFAGGRVESNGLDLARVRLVWKDGYELEDAVQNGIAMFLGTRNSLEPAIVEFLDHAGRVVASHPAFGPDEQ